MDCFAVANCDRKGFEITKCDIKSLWKPRRSFDIAKCDIKTNRETWRNTKGIATCIIVLKKSAKVDSSVLFIDASKLFQKNGNKNLLLPEHQDKIMQLFENRKDEDYLAKLVKNDDILANDCNLSVSSYVEQEDTREVINITEVNAKLETLIAEGNELNEKIEAIIKELGA